MQIQVVVNTATTNTTLFGAVLGWGAFLVQPFYPSHISYNNKTWHSYTLPRKDPKNIQIR